MGWAGVVMKIKNSVPSDLVTRTDDEIRVPKGACIRYPVGDGTYRVRYVLGGAEWSWVLRKAWEIRKTRGFVNAHKNQGG